MTVCFTIGLLGELLEVPRAARDLSPFEHLPRAPADRVELLAVALVLAVAAGLLLYGRDRLQRRDVG